MSLLAGSHNFVVHVFTATITNSVLRFYELLCILYSTASNYLGRDGDIRRDDHPEGNARLPVPSGRRHGASLVFHASSFKLYDVGI
jgi:hypothetical protein